ncbi:MAG: hypothetical protein K2P43_13595 [Lachnospiraceae bacterium]|nr:hypothetical protein [Lachnospiraceae bacterium]
MGKRFNTTGICYPDEHYMVNLDRRLDELTRLIDQNEYFTINRARQYGKTTTINLLEENGRRFFLLYLKPIINGIGNYYIEARTRSMRRTDVIIDYRGRQYVCELKIWRGEEYNRRGEQQLIDYLRDYHLTEGYMIRFNFNKKKKTGVRKIQIDGRTLVEAVV